MTILLEPTTGAAALADAMAWPSSSSGSAEPGALLTDPIPIRAELSLSGGTLQISCDRPEPEWLWTTLGALKRIAQLPSNWDTYRAPRIKDKAIVDALTIVGRILSREGAAPTVVPKSSGGVQLEWHQTGVDVEVSVSGTGAAQAYVSRIADGHEWEAEELAAPEFERLRKVLAAL